MTFLLFYINVNQPSLLQLYSQNSKELFSFKMRQWEPIFMKRKEQKLNLPPLRLSIIYNAR